MNQTVEIRRKRLRFRSHRRGIKELDLLLGRFAERHLASLSATQLERYEALLEVPEPVIYAWLCGRGTPPAEYDHDVLRLLRACAVAPVTP